MTCHAIKVFCDPDRIFIVLMCLVKKMPRSVILAGNLCDLPGISLKVWSCQKIIVELCGLDSSTVDPRLYEHFGRSFLKNCSYKRFVHKSDFTQFVTYSHNFDLIK